MVVQPDDERPHDPGPGTEWQEAWDFTFATADLSLAGYLRLAVVPAARAAWCWAAVVGSERPLVSVRHHELSRPAGWPHEVRGEGLWCGVFCETPLEHWTVGLEAFGVCLEDPLEAWAGERGDLVPLGFDLEWEDDPRIGTAEFDGGYRQWCEVHGDVLIGDESLVITAAGWRAHTWRDEAWDRPSSEDGRRPALVCPVLVPPHRVLRGVVASHDEPPTWAEWRGPAATEVAAAARTA